MKTKTVLCGVVLAALFFAVGCTGGGGAPITSLPENSSDSRPQAYVPQGSRVVMAQNAAVPYAETTFGAEAPTRYYAAQMGAVVDEYFYGPVAGGVKLTQAGGAVTDITAARFLAAYFAVEGEGAPVLWCADMAEAGLFTQIASAVSAEGEAVVFLSATVSGAELLEGLGLFDDAALYRFIFSDGYMMDCEAGQMDAAQIILAADGGVNALLPDAGGTKELMGLSLIEIITG